MRSIEEELSRTQLELDSVKTEYQQYAHAVSHDLSASFRHIEAFSTLILENNPDVFNDKTEKYFNFVINSADTGKRILAGLLEFSRLDTRAQRFTNVECSEVVDDVLLMLSETIDAKNASIDVAKLPELVADRDQLATVFFHLLKNALVFCKEDRPIRVSVTSKSTESGVEFAVCDNGIGIRAKQIGRIFEVLGRTVGADFPGVGMGLAISKRVVERHGGAFRVESEEGVGSTFFFTIKLAETA